MIQNIFCDFTNKEIRRLYGLYGNLDENLHKKVLSGWINAACLLAPEWCLVPIGFVAESRTLQEVLERKAPFLDGRLLRLAMRDSGIEDFVLRRRIGYQPFEDDYPPLFDDRTIAFLHRFSHALHARQGRTALQIGERWPAGIETAPDLVGVRGELTKEQIGGLQSLPQSIGAAGLGFTWNAVARGLPKDITIHTSKSIRRFLHADFVRGYMEEFDLGVLTNLPFGWRGLGVQQLGGYLDYSWLEAALHPSGMLRLLLGMDAQSLISLRNEPGFSAFQHTYRTICATAKSSYEVRTAFAPEATKLTQAASVALSKASINRNGDVDLSDEFLQSIGFALADAGVAAAERVGAPISVNLHTIVGATRVYVEDIEEFKDVRRFGPEEVKSELNRGRIELSEDAVQIGIESILAESFHKTDWGGEGNDLYSTNLHISGRRRAGAFLLKGNGLKARQMQIKDCGKNGDQLVRLVEAPADLFFVQYVGSISEAVIRDMELKIRALRHTQPFAQFCIMDGQETARLLRAYGVI